MKLCSTVALLGILTACGDSQPVQDPPKATSQKRGLEAGAVNLCDRWSDAAKRGDVDAALACFEQGREFSFAIDGEVIDEFDAFRELTRRSYAARKRLALRRESREVTVLGPKAVLVTGLDHFVITTTRGGETKGQYAYGIVCRQGDAGAWKIVHAYEMRRR